MHVSCLLHNPLFCNDSPLRKEAGSQQNYLIDAEVTPALTPSSYTRTPSPTPYTFHHFPTPPLWETRATTWSLARTHSNTNPLPRVKQVASKRSDSNTNTSLFIRILPGYKVYLLRWHWPLWVKQPSLSSTQVTRRKHTLPPGEAPGREQKGMGQRRVINIEANKVNSCRSEGGRAYPAPICWCHILVQEHLWYENILQGGGRRLCYR